MTVPAAPRPPERDRPRFTSRAAVLAVVLCAIALSLAYPVREYIGQRRQIDQLTAQRATAEVVIPGKKPPAAVAPAPAPVTPWYEKLWGSVRAANQATSP